NLDDLYINQKESHYVFVEKELDGTERISFWNISYLENQTKILSNVLKGLGISKKDKILNLLKPGISGIYFIFNMALEKVESTIIPLGRDTELDVIANFAEDLHTNVLVGETLFLLEVLEYLDRNKRNHSIDTVILAGSVLSQEQYNKLKKFVEKIFFPVYFSLETGIIGYQCPELQAGSFHLSNTVFVELIDPISGELTELNNGEILVTSLLNRASPCIKYRKGDLIQFLNKTCKCSDSNPVFKLQDILSSVKMEV
ncbi:MAG: hypothetical protein KAS63_10560, partial [Candidatus Heimdallarchaeota archaeon]|nr:hypothetical protein [Candidatus Heimdallarchaeota archaeon]MCK4955796.1 hypothetical protein [Candidatus Heimdallarchaeota archaeon]